VKAQASVATGASGAMGMSLHLPAALSVHTLAVTQHHSTCTSLFRP